MVTCPHCNKEFSPMAEGVTMPDGLMSDGVTEIEQRINRHVATLNKLSKDPPDMWTPGSISYHQNHIAMLRGRLVGKPAFEALTDFLHGAAVTA